MKLSTKISVSAAVFLFLFSQIFSLWLLNRMKEETTENIVQQEWEELQRDSGEFAFMVKERSPLNFAGATYWGRESFMKCFSENSLLFFEKKEIFNTTPYEFDLEKIQEKLNRKVDGDQKMIPVREYRPSLLESVEGEKLMIFLVEKEPYQIIHYRDVTELYEQITSLFWGGMIGALALCGLLVVSFQLVIRKILTPLYRLKTASDGFVRGNYRERLPVVKKDEIGEISQAFNHMADRVEKHIQELGEENEKQRRLLGSLAHELKTPMTAIQGYAQTLQRISLPPEKQEKSLAYIEKECRRLSQLSAKMLELTRLSEGMEVECKKIPVTRLFEEVRDTSYYRLKEKDLHLEMTVSKGLWIMGDEDLLQSFLINLVDNACKASSPGGRIRMEGSCEGMFVLDEGKGLAEEEIKKIAEPFYMADKSRARKEGGAGLGLALCEQIARIHGGKLIMENLPGRGFCAGIFTDWLQEGEDLETGGEL